MFLQNLAGWSSFFMILISLFLSLLSEFANANMKRRAKNIKTNVKMCRLDSAEVLFTIFFNPCLVIYHIPQSLLYLNFCTAVILKFLLVG